MNTKQNFFDHLDGGWGNTLSDVYENTINNYTFEVISKYNMPIFRITKNEDEYHSLTAVRKTEENNEIIKNISFLNIDSNQDFLVRRNRIRDFYNYESTYEINTKLKNVLINEKTLYDIFFEDEEIKKAKGKINLIAGTMATMKYLEDYEDMMVSFFILYHKNNKITIKSLWFSHEYELKENIDLNKFKKKYEK